MNSSVAAGRPAKRRRNYRLRGYVVEALSILLSVVLIIWSVTPIYNMVLIALERHNDVFGSSIIPPNPSLHSFWIVFSEGYWYLQYFWHQFGNSMIIGFWTVLLTLSIGSLTCFAVSRMRIRKSWLITNAAMLTYVIPASFLAIPFYRIMQIYGLSNNLWSVIAAEVTFATPYAIFIFQQYGTSIPIELDEFRAHRWCHAAAGVFPHLPAADGAGAGRRRHLCATARVERVSIPVPVAIVEAQHDRARCAGAIPQQR